MSKVLEERVAAYRKDVRNKTYSEATYWLNQYIRLAGDLLESVRRLREENERLRVQLAGCGVAAMQNTADSRAHRINRDDYGWSASYADVCSAVDREISLREENERLRKDAERYQWFRVSENWRDSGPFDDLYEIELDSAIDAARGAK